MWHSGVCCCTLEGVSPSDLFFPRTKLRNRVPRPTDDEEVFQRQANLCRAFANPIRLHILDILGHGDCHISSLLEQLAISKANLSQHLGILKSAGVVVTHRRGREVVCSMAVPQIKDACHLIRDVLRAQIRETARLAENRPNSRRG